MTIKELKQAINDLPDNMDVMVYQTNDEYGFSLSETAQVQPVQFQDEEVPEDEWPTVDCLVISDEI